MLGALPTPPSQDWDLNLRVSDPGRWACTPTGSTESLSQPTFVEGTGLKPEPQESTRGSRSHRNPPAGCCRRACGPHNREGTAERSLSETRELVSHRASLSHLYNFVSRGGFPRSGSEALVGARRGTGQGTHHVGSALKAWRQRRRGVEGGVERAGWEAGSQSRKPAIMAALEPAKSGQA